MGNQARIAPHPQLTLDPGCALAYAIPDLVVWHALIALVRQRHERKLYVVHPLRHRGLAQLARDAREVSPVAQTVEDSEPDLDEVGKVAEAVPAQQPLDVVGG